MSFLFKDVIENKIESVFESKHPYSESNYPKLLNLLEKSEGGPIQNGDYYVNSLIKFVSVLNEAAEESQRKEVIPEEVKKSSFRNKQDGD